MKTEAAPITTTEAPDTGIDVEVFAPVSPENRAVEAGYRNPNRASVRTLDRIAAFIDDKSEALANRRTGSEVIADSLTSAQTAVTEKVQAGKEFGTAKVEQAKATARSIGAKASRGIVRVATAPGRVGERFADSLDRGMSNFEARAIAAQDRKEARQAQRAEAKAQRQEFVQRYNQQRAEAKQEKKTARAERRDEVRQKARRIGQFVLQAPNTVRFTADVAKNAAKNKKDEVIATTKRSASKAKANAYNSVNNKLSGAAQKARERAVKNAEKAI